MAAWDKKRNEVIFQDKQVQNDDSGESGNDSEEIEDETSESSGEDQNVLEGEIDTNNEADEIGEESNDGDDDLPY